MQLLLIWSGVTLGFQMIKWIIVASILSISTFTFASNNKSDIQIHVYYQSDSDSWKVRYDLPKATKSIVFSRNSHFDRRKLYRIDEQLFEWAQDGDALAIKRKDGSSFNSLSLNFLSYYDVLQKDYAQNIKYADGGVLLYTNHLTIDIKDIEDKSELTSSESPERDPSNNSLTDTTLFHFYSPKKKIVFLGNRYDSKAQYVLSGNGTYVYFGDIKPIETETMIAVIDSKLPKWTWRRTQKYFPELFEYYKEKTEQPLNFKPIVFFNYGERDADYSNYSGGTLDGVVQLTINGRRWETENTAQFNLLFHFLAHEATHFWNGQMFSPKEPMHSWMHEGGADAFANFAMLEFGLINSEQFLGKFESAVNRCLLNKGKESLEQSLKLSRFQNYYACGAAMALASHYAVKTSNSDKSLFDLWKLIFKESSEKKAYTEENYFDALKQLTGSDKLPKLLARFSSQSGVNNQQEVMSWFSISGIRASLTNDYPSSVIQYWGKQVVYNLMSSHCKGISFSTYHDYIKTYPITGCEAFAQSMEVQFINGHHILNQGLAAYDSFKRACEKGGLVQLQNREKVSLAEINCQEAVPEILPYIKFEMSD